MKSHIVYTLIRNMHWILTSLYGKENKDMNSEFEGKVAVVTGAGGVLCSSLAMELARQGARVALLNRTLSKAEAVAEEIRAEGGIAKAYGCNVLDKASLEEVHSQVLADLGPCDFLINGAGGNNSKANTTKEHYEAGDLENSEVVSFFDLDQKGFESVLNLNFMGSFLPSQVFVQDMIGREGCSVLNISSMNAFTPLTKIPAYSGAKAAISNFTQWMAVHFASAGIRVNAIAPGFFATTQNMNLLFNADGSPTDRTSHILAQTPMKRFGEKEELNGAMCFLLDPTKASFITGVVLPVDGGFNAFSGV